IDSAGNLSSAAVVPTIIQDASTPTVTDPTGDLTINATSYTIQGTALAGSTVTIYRDNDLSGTVSAGDTIVGAQTLATGVTTYGLSVPLIQNTSSTPLGVASDLLVKASNTAVIDV